MLIVQRCATRRSKYKEADGYFTMASTFFSHLEAISILQGELSSDFQQSYLPVASFLRCLFFHHQAWLCSKRGNLEMGIDYFNQCLRRLDRSLEIRGEGELQPQCDDFRASVLQGLGILKLCTKQVQEAVEHYALCIATLDLHPDYFGHRLLITVHVQKGYAHLMNNQPKEAEASFILASDLAKRSRFEENIIFETRYFPMYVPLILRSLMLIGFSKLVSSYGLVNYGLTLTKLNQHAINECIEFALEFLSLCSSCDQLKGAIYIIMSCCHARNGDRYLAM